MVAWEELEKAGTTWADLSGVTWAELEETCEKGSSNIAQKDLEDRDGEYPIYGASGFIKNVDFYQQETPYIAVVKDGAGVGRVMRLPAKSSVIGTMQYILPKNNVDTGYLAYALEHMNLSKYYTGATIPHIYFKDYKKEKFPLPPLDEQRRIAAVLDKVSGLIAKRREQLDKLDELLKARFVEMFGDPVSNPKGWNIIRLSELGDCKNGMNFHTDDSGVEIHCLGVGDFKNLSSISDTAKLPIITLNEMPTNDYLLKNGDIVFVRSNGNKALVGRSVIVYPDDTPTTFSGFCIRFRIQNPIILPQYLLSVLKTASMRKQMTGRGANIQNLNQKILSELKIPVSPLPYQEEYIDFTIKIDKSKLTIQQSLDKLEVLKKALMQQYFG